METIKGARARAGAKGYTGKAHNNYGRQVGENISQLIAGSYERIGAAKNIQGEAGRDL